MASLVGGARECDTSGWAESAKKCDTSEWAGQGSVTPLGGRGEGVTPLSGRGESDTSEWAG